MGVVHSRVSGSWSDEIRQGPWHPSAGGGTDYFLFRQGADVVVTRGSGDFVTLMQGAREMDGIDELAGSTSPEWEVVDRLRSVVHRRLCKVRRLFFTFGQEVDRTYGAVELTFDRTILLDV